MPQLKSKGGVNTFSTAENWNLTIPLIVFLENIAKTTDNGRVLPWSHFKNLVYDFYKDYIDNLWEI